MATLVVNSSKQSEALTELLLSSSEFQNSKSTSYGSQLKYRSAINELFIEKKSISELFISENAGHGGINENMAILTITENGEGSQVAITLKTGGLPFKWLTFLFGTISVLSISLIFLNAYFIILALALLGITTLSYYSNRKFVKTLMGKLVKIMLVKNEN